MAKEAFLTAEKAVRPLQVYVAASASSQPPGSTKYLFRAARVYNPDRLYTHTHGARRGNADLANARTSGQGQ